MGVAQPRQSTVASPAIGDDRRSRLDMVRHELTQRRSRSVGERCDPAPSHPLRTPDLDRDSHQDLSFVREGFQRVRQRSCSPTERLRPVTERPEKMEDHSERIHEGQLGVERAPGSATVTAYAGFGPPGLPGFRETPGRTRYG